MQVDQDLEDLTSTVQAIASEHGLLGVEEHGFRLGAHATPAQASRLLELAHAGWLLAEERGEDREAVAVFGALWNGVALTLRIRANRIRPDLLV